MSIFLSVRQSVCLWAPWLCASVLLCCLCNDEQPLRDIISFYLHLMATFFYDMTSSHMRIPCTSVMFPSCLGHSARIDYESLMCYPPKPLTRMPCPVPYWLNHLDVHYGPDSRFTSCPGADSIVGLGCMQRQTYP